MINLTHRSPLKELMDEDNIPFDDMKTCLRELNKVNTLLGGHSITISGVKEIAGNNMRDLSVCEIGCGGGDNLHAIDKHFSEQDLSFTGIDLKKECTDFAQQQYHSLNAEWITSDYRLINFEKKPDIIFSSLFCHHFTNEELVTMMKWMHANSSKGFFINDLQRHPVAYYLIKWITAVFSKSYLVKNDACISVARSFRKKDWTAIFEKAGIKNYSIRWRWAFRYLVVCKKVEG